MDIRIDNEWLRWGEELTNYVGFFAPIEIANLHEGMICVNCKYGRYCVDPETQKVTTTEGVDYDILVEVANYGMNFASPKKSSWVSADHPNAREINGIYG